CKLESTPLGMPAVFEMESLAVESQSHHKLRTSSKPASVSFSADVSVINNIHFVRNLFNLLNIEKLFQLLAVRFKRQRR
ncbi:hypothetical protein AVEN_247355-1, partial [Araneus ventricosus]